MYLYRQFSFSYKKKKTTTKERKKCIILLRRIDSRGKIMKEERS